LPKSIVWKIHSGDADKNSIITLTVIQNIPFVNKNRSVPTVFEELIDWKENN
jgi:hypothetical protein